MAANVQKKGCRAKNYFICRSWRLNLPFACSFFSLAVFLKEFLIFVALKNAGHAVI
jgi:hypothetical protein